MGWKKNKDGILEKDGAKLAVTLSTHSEDPNRVQTLEFMQAIFREAGVEAKAQITDWPSFSPPTIQKSQHQIALLGWLNIVDPDRLPFAQLTTGGSTNWGGYSNPAVDAALQEGRSALDQAARLRPIARRRRSLRKSCLLHHFDQGYQLFYSRKLPVTVQATPRGKLRADRLQLIEQVRASACPEKWVPCFPERTCAKRKNYSHFRGRCQMNSILFDRKWL